MFLHFLIVLALQVSVQNNSSHDPTCKEFYTGKFRCDVENMGVLKIHRTKTEQRETVENGDFDVIFSIKWIDDCTYDLTPKKVIKGNPAILNAGTVRTKIKSFTETGYISESTAEGSDQVVKVHIEKIN